MLELLNGMGARLFYEAPSVCYTLITDDITKGKKPPQTPYVDRQDPLLKNGDYWAGAGTLSTLSVTPYMGGCKLSLRAKGQGLSQFGINLPINFMSKKNGGGWENQFLFNTPYVSPDKSIMYFYLTNPSGKNFVIASTSTADGWKMDYSSYGWGHFFVNLKLLATFDKAYGTQSTQSELSFVILPVASYEDCLDTLAKLYGAPMLDYDVSGGALGEEINLVTYGEYDCLLEEHCGKTRTLPPSNSYKITHEGEVTLTPVCGGTRGAPITVYGYENLEGLYKKSMLSVDLDVIAKNTDGNLCEHQCWASATLRFLMKHKSLLSQEETLALESKVLSLLKVITEKDEERAIPHRTILKAPHDRYPAYNVYKSCRVQELAFGITILLDAYRYFGDSEYLEYAKGATECLISYYQKENGAIFVDWGDGTAEDYTTVCAPMIPLCDMAKELEGTPLGDTLRQRCDKMADFLYNRGLSFPTEGGVSDKTDTEMEEGSISCTALSLLYYCYNIKKVDCYVEKAKEILDLHENWIIKAPICQMHRSTLRWWETQWEGDADGPAICAGHAWSIWRGEADLLYYLLTKDEEYKINAQNTFMTNLAKIRRDGTSYSTYNPDMINGGGFSDRAENVKFQIAPKFSTRHDCGISRYVWLRIGNYI